MSSVSVDPGAVSSGSTFGVSLDDLSAVIVPDNAVIVKAVVRNDSRADISFPGIPGAPIVSPGERIEIGTGNSIRDFVGKADAAVSAGELQVTITWEVV